MQDLSVVIVGGGAGLGVGVGHRDAVACPAQHLDVVGHVTERDDRIRR